MSRTDLDTWEDNVARKQRRRGDGEGQRVDFVTKLGAAKQALALAAEMPDITVLIDNADAVRAAARALHVSATGVNAWTRFMVDAERKGWSRIEAMRAAGELAKQGHHKSKNTNLVFLDDLIDHLANKRAQEWSLLSRLTEVQLDEMERIANDEDRLLTRAELLRLAKAGMPEASKAESKDRSEKELAILMKAQESIEGFEHIRIHDDAKILDDDNGWLVQAWIFVEDDLSKSDIEDD
jgi:hypothetical protein